MTISKVFEICNAYETGVGHGQKRDGHTAGPYSDPELNEAYEIGYNHVCHCGCSAHELLNDIHTELKETLKQGVGLSRVEKLMPKIEEFLDGRKNMS